MSFVKKTLRKSLNFIKHRWVYILIILVVAGVTAYFFWPKQSAPIATVTTKLAPFTQSVSVSGKVDALESVNLTFQTAETLSYVGVKPSDHVSVGQLIASLDQNQLQASLRQAEQDFVAGKAASQQYYDDHKNATESDAEKVQRTAIDAAQNKAYDQIVKVRHDIVNSSLYSPIAGIVTRVDAQTAGVNITPATTFSIANPDSLVFEMDVDEADIAKIKLSQQVKVNLDAYPDTTIDLTVSNIDFSTHPTSTGGNAYTVQSTFPANPDLKYRVGMEGNADIVTAFEASVITVPISSLVDNNYVYVKNAKGKFIKTKVELGLQNDTEAVVNKGLSEGDQVVIDPTQVPQK